MDRRTVLLAALSALAMPLVAKAKRESNRLICNDLPVDLIGTSPDGKTLIFVETNGERWDRVVARYPNYRWSFIGVTPA